MNSAYLLTIPLLLAGSLRAADISYAGGFTADDDMFSVNFNLASMADVTLQTWSFAGGIDAAGAAIAAGGFAPVVSLFDSADNLLLFDDGGTPPSTCALRNIDPASGFCLDAYINAVLPAGTYTAVLTEWDNTPNGPTLADGFDEQGNGNFTGGPFLLNAGTAYQRTGNWELDVPGADQASVPEPSFMPFLAALFLAGAAVQRWRRPRAQTARRSLGTAMFLLLPMAGMAATANVAADTYISSTSPASNYGGGTTLNIGGGNSALIALDLSGLPAGLTVSNIQKATLTVFVNKAFTTGGLDIAQVAGLWYEGAVTYNGRPTAGLAFQSDVTVSGSDTYVTFDITGPVQQWVTGMAPNYGVEITAALAQSLTVVSLDSKESTSTSHPAYAEITLVSTGPAGPAGPTGIEGPQGPSGLQGTQGPSGAPGVPGVAGINWRAAWSAATPYSANDGVSVLGNSWIALTANQGSLPPVNPGQWSMLASEGPAGSQGPQGSTGAQGPQGPAGAAGAAGSTGPVGLNWRGTWAGGGTIYFVNDAVYYNGSSYLSLANTENTPPGTNPAAWTLLAAAGSPGAPGAVVTNYANYNCPTGSSVTGFDNSGTPICAPGAIVCTTTTYTAGISSYTWVYTNNSLLLEYWPDEKVLIGAGYCSASVYPPGPDSSGNLCSIDGTQGCSGWKNLTVSEGYSSCTMTVNTPGCGSAAAVGRVDGTFPACSSASPNGQHSTSTVTVTCHP